MWTNFIRFLYCSREYHDYIIIFVVSLVVFRLMRIDYLWLPPTCQRLDSPLLVHADAHSTTCLRFYALSHKPTIKKSDDENQKSVSKLICLFKLFAWDCFLPWSTNADLRDMACTDWLNPESVLAAFYGRQESKPININFFKSELSLF